jgi:hypothetical protein
MRPICERALVIRITYTRHTRCDATAPMTFKHVVIDQLTGAAITKDMTATNAVEARAELQALIDDCPECQALRARGEQPVVLDGRTLRAMTGLAKFRRPRWRDLKRRAGR